MRSRPAVLPPLKIGVVFAPGNNIGGGPGGPMSVGGLRRAAIRLPRGSAFWAGMWGDQRLVAGMARECCRGRGSTILRK